RDFHVTGVQTCALPISPRVDPHRAWPRTVEELPGVMMGITPAQALQRTIEHREIFHDEMVALMRMIMRGEVSPAMTAAILTGLRSEERRGGKECRSGGR